MKCTPIIKGTAGRLALAGGMLALFAGVATGAAAQNYPSKPVRMLVGTAPGGPIDLVARITAQRLTQALGQSFVVENRPGAGGTITTELVARSTPDGYTLLMASAATLCVTPHLYSKIGYDSLRDFAPVSTVAGTWFGLVAPAGTSPDIVARLNGVIVKDLADPAVKKGLLAQGLDPMGNTPEAFAKFLREELVKWGKVVKISGAKVD